MKKCSICGKELSDGAKFCSGCGNQYQEVPSGTHIVPPVLAEQNVNVHEQKKAKPNQKKKIVTVVVGIAVILVIFIVLFGLEGSPNNPLVEASKESYTGSGSRFTFSPQEFAKAYYKANEIVGIGPEQVFRPPLWSEYLQLMITQMPGGEHITIHTYLCELDSGHPSNFGIIIYSIDNKVLAIRYMATNKTPELTSADNSRLQSISSIIGYNPDTEKEIKEEASQVLGLGLYSNQVLLTLGHDESYNGSNSLYLIRATYTPVEDDDLEGILKWRREDGHFED